MKKLKRTRNGLSYMGSKYKLLPWIHENLPNNIENLKTLDVFGGGGSVTFSLKETFPNIDITYNDFSEYSYKVVKYVATTPAERMLKDLDGYIIADNINMVEEWRNKTDLWFKEKEKFQRVKKYLNLTVNAEPFLLYWYLTNTINSSFRMNKKGKHNASKGNKCVNYKRIKKHKTYNINCTNEDFKNIDFNAYDFLYLDPPYFTTDENREYSGTFKNFDNELLEKLENYKGSFLLSNYENEKYINWAIKNNFKIEYKEDKKINVGNSTKTTEILIKNF